MSYGINKVMLIGRLGANPEVITTKAGTQMASFSIATESHYIDKPSGEKVKNVEWHRIVAFGALANIVNAYVFKGSQVYIEGALQTRKWTDKGGSDRYTTEVLGKNILMLSNKIRDVTNSTINAKDGAIPGLDDEPF